MEPQMSQLVPGTRVVAYDYDEDRHRSGTVLSVNEEGQGDFEYVVEADDGTSSFWPRESLTVVR
jgi:hypothetical protein